MAKKKRVVRRKTSAKVEARIPLREKPHVAWRSFVTFLVLSILSYVLYRFSISDLFVNFFGVMTIILSFLTLAFLIAFIVLELLKSSSKKK